MSDSEDDWTPPTEAEMKVLQAKRERSDKISKLMGDYLLKGYKMLATSCPICSTIELADRAGAVYCVACMEVDCHETSKAAVHIGFGSQICLNPASSALITQRSVTN